MEFNRGMAVNLTRDVYSEKYVSEKLNHQLEPLK